MMVILTHPKAKVVLTATISTLLYSHIKELFTTNPLKNTKLAMSHLFNPSDDNLSKCNDINCKICQEIHHVDD